jgi:hypothetical protein
MNKFKEWQNNNYAKIIKPLQPYAKYVWLSLFIFTIVIIAIPSGIGLYAFFTFPTTPISVTQPANVWLLVLMTNVVSRPFLLGFFACYCLLAFNRACTKSKLNDSYNQRVSEVNSDADE